MNALTEMVEYVVENGAPAEPAVRALLLLLLSFAVLKYVVGVLRYVLGRSGRAFVVKMTSVGVRRVQRRSRRGYAPEWERLRARVAPYGNLFFSFCFALLYLCFGVIASLLMIDGYPNAPWWAVPPTVAYALLYSYCMRVELENASWAYHAIMERRRSAT